MNIKKVQYLETSRGGDRDKAVHERTSKENRIPEASHTRAQGLELKE